MSKRARTASPVPEEVLDPNVDAEVMEITTPPAPVVGEETQNQAQAWSQQTPMQVDPSGGEVTDVGELQIQDLQLYVASGWSLGVACEPGVCVRSCWLFAVDRWREVQGKGCVGEGRVQNPPKWQTGNLPVDGGKWPPCGPHRMPDMPLAYQVYKGIHQGGCHPPEVPWTPGP